MIDQPSGVEWDVASALWLQLRHSSRAKDTPVYMDKQQHINSKADNQSIMITI